jgi:prepilin-type processing-associated H-X9-DG protein
MPALGQARRKAYQALCTSNEKQLGIATQMYTDSNDGWYMGNWKDSNTFMDDSSWHYKLRDSLNLSMGDGNKGQYKEEVPNVLHCPMEPQPYKDDGVRTYSSYQFTRRHGDSSTSNPGIVVRNFEGGKRQDTIAYSSETVAAAEQHQSGYLNVVGGSVVKSETFNLFEGAIDYSPLIYPHKQNYIQVLWVDGHVKITNRMTIFDTSENTDHSNPKGTLWDSDRE